MQNHLDVGYNGIPGIGFINNILNIYFQEYYPRALYIAQEVREHGGTDRFVYTTHPWLMSLYLDCPPNMNLSGIVLQCPDEAAVSGLDQCDTSTYTSLTDRGIQGRSDAGGHRMACRAVQSAAREHGADAVRGRTWYRR